MCLKVSAWLPFSLLDTFTVLPLWAFVTALPLHSVPTECLILCQELLLLDHTFVKISLFCRSLTEPFRKTHTISTQNFRVRIFMILSKWGNVTQPFGKKFRLIFLPTMYHHKQRNSCMPILIFTHIVAKILTEFYYYTWFSMKFFSPEYWYYSSFFLLLLRLNKLLLFTCRLITHKKTFLCHDHTVFTVILNFIFNTLLVYFFQCYQHSHTTGLLLGLEFLKGKNTCSIPCYIFHGQLHHHFICYFKQSLFSCSLLHFYFQYLRTHGIFSLLSKLSLLRLSYHMSSLQFHLT